MLLATARVRVLNLHHLEIPARVLLDQGSQISLVSERLVQQLQLTRTASRVNLTGVGFSHGGRTRGSVTLCLKPHFKSSFEVTVHAHVLPRLTSVLPPATMTPLSWDHIKPLSLADPDYAQPGHIDILHGVEIYGQLIDGPIIKGPPGTPVAQLSSFGWILSGATAPQSSSAVVSTFQCSVNNQLSDLLERFWHLEEVTPVNSHSLSAHDQQCEDQFRATHYRNADGRYVVRLPFRLPVSNLGDSLPAARRMLATTQRKCLKDQAYATLYSAFLKEYEDLRHMVRVSTSEPEPVRVFYLPHHAVIRESSSTTKLRVVFNGSCSVTAGLPLNELLHSGEKLQTEIFDVLLWLRQFKYIYACDVEKMYRQIQVDPADHALQRILWNDGDQTLRFNLTTVTYGLACAPFLALRVMKQLVIDEGHRFPKACDVMTRGRYVDDIFGGSDTIQGATLQLQEVNGLCTAGGFPLRKWTSNDPQVIQDLPLAHRNPATSVSLSDTTLHALGLSWNPKSDSFSFSSPPSVPTPLTKRAIVSRVAQLFDPLGFLAPVLISAKAFIQELWAIKVFWDEPLPSSKVTSWESIFSAMTGLDAVQIPRWTRTLSTDTLEIHGFCDASQAATAAVIYLRVVNSEGDTQVSFVCAKTKVAPLKRMTIPRLELSAAVLLTRLVSKTSRVLSLSNCPCYLWTDSSIVFAWLSSHPSRWKDFVHNRTCYIQETLPHAQWKHVAGTSNPADCASRGISASELSFHALWWHGPPWLSLASSAWPTAPVSRAADLSTEERRSAAVTICHATSDHQTWDLIERYSSFTRLLRVTATCTRVLRRLRKIPESSLTFPLTPEELDSARQFWVRATQRQAFASETKLIQANRELPRSSPLIRLCPFLDATGILRVRGRLEHSRLDPTAKHPYILPRQSPLTTLVIREAHLKTLHGSTQDTLSFLRNTFWIIGGRAPVRSHILKCVTCIRHRRSQAQHIMGQLPPSRVNPSRAFLNTGLDYAGPYSLKTWKGKSSRTYKAWVALFVCLSTSAIHLELVTDYTSEALLAAYKRFSARRGICATLLSDCGTNFKGGDRQLRELFAASSSELRQFATLISHDGTKWLFNPPAAPHFGGKWEAGVKSMKHHLKRVADNSLLTYEEFSTLLTTIEAILNSRPLCPLSDDPDDLIVLTPGHFLVGHPLSLIPEPCLLSTPTNRLARWQRISQMVQSFWKQWSRGYLQQFHAIHKWNRASPPLAVGNLVLVIDERYPPSKWPLGRVIQVHPGSDEVVRVVTVKTATTILQRPVAKLCPLFSPS